MNVANRKWLVPVLVIGLGAVFAESATAVPITFSAAGSRTSIQGTVDAFRSVLSETRQNGVMAGTQPTGRRELDWDLSAAGTMLPSSFASRGALLTTPGTGFLIFPGDQTFSSPNLLSPVGSNVLDVFFTVPK